MVNYRISCILLVMSCWCLAVAMSAGSLFYVILSTVAVMLASQIYAVWVPEKRTTRR